MVVGLLIIITAMWLLGVLTGASAYLGPLAGMRDLTIVVIILATLIIIEGVSDWLIASKLKRLLDEIERGRENLSATSSYCLAVASRV